MSLTFSNFVRTTITNVGGITAVQTTIDVADVSYFPSVGTGQWMRIVLRNLSAPTIKEVCIVTGIAGNTLTVLRAQEGTTGVAFALGTEVLGWITRDFFHDLVNRNNFVWDTSIADHGNVTVPKTIAYELAEISSNPRKLEISPGTFTIQTALSIPSTVTTELHDGAIIDCQNAVTINGPIRGSNTQHFTITGGSLTVASSDTVFTPEMWGAANDGVTGDRDAWNKMVTSLGSGATVKLVRGSGYLIDSGFTMPGDIKIIQEDGAKLIVPNGITLDFSNPIVDIAAPSGWLQINSGGVVTGTFNVPAYYPTWLFALGDDVTDSGVPIQTCLTMADVNGGHVKLLVGKFRTGSNLFVGDATLFEGVTFMNRTGSDQFGTSIRALDGFADDDLIRNKVQANTVKNGIVQNLAILGNHSVGRALRGIHLENIKYWTLRNLFLEYYDNEGIFLETAQSTSTSIRDILIQNSVLASGLATTIGAMTINSYDNTIDTCELVPDGTQVAILEGLKRVSLYVNGANNYLNNIQAAFGEIGILVGSSGSRTEMSNVRADRNLGPGFRLSVGGCELASCQALNNSQASSNTYDGFELLAQNNVLACCKSISNLAAVHRHGFYDGSGNVGNRLAACHSTGHGTAEFGESISTGAWDTNARARVVTSTVDDTTPSIDETSLLKIPVDTANRIITTLDNGKTGQLVSLTKNSDFPYATIKHDGTTFALNSTFYPKANDTLLLQKNEVGIYTEIARQERGRASKMIKIDVTGLTVGTFYYYPLDDNCTIINAGHEIITGVTGAGSLGIGIESLGANLIKTSVLITDPSWATPGSYQDVPVFHTPGTWTTKTTSAGLRIMLSATNNLTAGLFYLWFDYVITE